MLNRNAIGEYKFSHKSILEYFLALEVFTNPNFRNGFFFNPDLDTAKKFFLEMIRHQKDDFKDKANIIEFEKKYDISKLGISDKEIETFSSTEYITKSLEEILSTLFKTSIRESFSIMILVSSLSFLATDFINLGKLLNIEVSKLISAIISIATSFFAGILYSYIRYLKVKAELKGENSKSVEVKR